VPLEISGRDILQVNYAVTYIINENERVVLDFDYLVSRTTTATGADIVDWSDGVRQRTFTWEAEVPILTDGFATSYALLIPSRDDPDVALVNGEYQSSQGGAPVEAQLIFDLNAQQATQMWGFVESGSGTLQPFEIQVVAGDTFKPQWLTMDANNELVGTSFGQSLALDPANPITFRKTPAPSGTYSISFVAENVAGERTLDEAIIQVSNDGLDESLRGYTDLTYGVNFLYPATWIRPRFTPDGLRLFTADLETNTILSLFPYTDVASAEATAQAVRASWNQLQNLQVLNERQIEINGVPAYVIDYSYSFQGEERLGAVVAIYSPAQNVGYGFDLDAPAASPGPAEQALAALVSSINFFQPAEVAGVSEWQTVNTPDGQASFPVPSNWVRETSGNWVMYGPADDKAIFIGVQSAAASGESKEALAQSWVSQLESGTENLQILASEPYYVGSHEWYLVVFTYDEAGTTLGGALFVNTIGAHDLTIWLEAPNNQFDALYAETFSVAVNGFALASEAAPAAE